MKQLIIVVGILFCMACNSNTANKIITDNNNTLDTSKDIYYVGSEDPGMNSAINNAKMSLDKFDIAFKSNDTAFMDFSIKKRYNTPTGGGEHMWISVINISDSGYTGYVNNDADETTEVKYGDTVFVSKSEITDWMYLDNNILRGGYTFRESRNHLSPTERAKMDKELGFKIED